MIDHSLAAGRTMDRVPADLLLPSCLLPFALRLKSGYEWRDLIEYLVNRHRARILQISDKGENLRFRYQAEGLNLKRICYIPYRDVTAQLRMLSYASRISMCALVVLMIEWERTPEVDPELDSFIGVPIQFDSGWKYVGTLLHISAGIQMSCVNHPPPTAKSP